MTDFLPILFFVFTAERIHSVVVSIATTTYNDGDEATLCYFEVEIG
jgi:hypothetical protein